VGGAVSCPFRLPELPCPTHLWLRSPLGSDAGVVHLKELKALTVLNVASTKITPKGAEDLVAALPGCKITHDGGTIEPMK
jgi:eukaryotic-like serine/threonine-protein kinase